MRFKDFLSVLLLSVVSFSFVSSKAQAQGSDNPNRVTSLVYVCGMTFKVSGKSASLVLGYTYLTGEGKITCYDVLTGRSQEIPTKVTIRGPAAGVSYQNAVISANISGIGLSKGPEALLGNYLSIRSSAAIGVGVGFSKSIRVAKDAVVLDLGVEGTQGLGFQTDLLKVTIEARDTSEALVAGGAVSAVPVEIVYVKENQPVQIIDGQGRLMKVIMLKQVQ